MLTVRALKNYGEKLTEIYGNENDLAIFAKKMYVELKTNIYNTVFKEWKRTGFIWEQYDDVTGRGKGTRAFSGWSALVIMLE